MDDAQKRHLKDIDRAVVWHPFTQMRDYADEEPVIISHGDGVYLVDIDGNRYLDGFSSMWCNVHGHRVAEIDCAIRAQLDRVAHSTLLGLSNIPAVQLAEKLVQIAPKGLSRVFFSDSGATAVEVAVKMAFQYWQQRAHSRREKDSFLHLTESYHGDTIGSVSVGGIAHFHSVYRPLLFSSIAAPVPHDRTCFGVLEETIAEHADRLAAFIVEPLVQGAGGMLMHPPGFLKYAAELCDKYDVLLIADEVATGFGRTGKMFACEHEDVAPDLLCLGKGLTGGYLPVAATLATDEIYNAFLGDYAEMKTFFHGHTYTGNPLGCAAALATIEKFEADRTLEKLQSKIAYLADQLHRFRDLAHVGDVRQRGFIVAVDLVLDRANKTPYPFEDRMGHQVCDVARENGLLIRPLVNTIVLMPPYAVTKDEIDYMVDIIFDAIQVVTEGDEQ